MNDILKSCEICPRRCKVDRANGKKGYCGETATLQVARAALHMWEEPCLSGDVGSGTVFFSGCNLRCVFCQNYNIAHCETGKNITVERLAEIFIELQDKKALNINLVTPTHYVPHIIDAVELARKKGLTLPLVYNTSGYEDVDTIKRLEDIVDIYLPDFKYIDSNISSKYSNAPDYFDVAVGALREMVRQHPTCVFDENGIMEKGVIVRHLALPGCMEDSKKVIKYLHDTYGNQIYMSIMNQYTPLPQVKDYPELNRKITDEEYDELLDYAIDIGVENAFIQEGGTAEESFIPPFDNEGV